jgi:hypothetical protein
MFKALEEEFVIRRKRCPIARNPGQKNKRHQKMGLE